VDARGQVMRILCDPKISGFEAFLNGLHPGLGYRLESGGRASKRLRRSSKAESKNKAFVPEANTVCH
jgi:hypothetical protein